MLSAFFTGFFLGISLIVAIGAQNAFVLRQGIIGKHIIFVVLFCAISDSFLITLGVIGISFFINNLINEFSNIIFGFSALWLFGYGVIRLRSAFKGNIILEIANSESKSLISTISILAFLTFANPHVYLDTMLLIGSVSQQFIGDNKIAFAIGASLASFIFFFALGFGAKILSPIMKKPSSWRVLDGFISVVMFLIAFGLASEADWI